MQIDENLKNRAKAIRLLILDVDGVLTDGRLYYGPDATELKVFNTLDGHGIKMLIQSGVEIAIITGRTSEQITRRAQMLGIRHVIQGREDKMTALRELLAEHPLPLDQIAMMGDDWPDLAVMVNVGLALTVPNAHLEVRQRAHWQSRNSGGLGAVRDACDLILQAQDKYSASLEFYLKPHTPDDPAA
jgi:3-deoxy-D-manno-octulosonate 8-phosphate phosphatase (KDO 8-P phosphatase)